ncbi:MAG: ABC transporter permease subunit [Bermanella sp.]
MHNHPQVDPPSIFSTVWVIISLELSRVFSSRQGLIYLAVFTFFWYLVINYGVVPFAVARAEQGSTWLAAVFKNYENIAVYGFTFLCLFVGANQTGSDRERGTLRFMSLRCSRDEIFFGRFLSQVLIQYALIIISLVMLILIVTYQHGLDAMLVPSALLAAGNIAIILLPFIALMALVSVWVSQSRQATFYAGLLWSLSSILVGLINDYLPILSPLNILVPGMQFSKLGELDGMAKFTLAYIPLLQCALLLVAGRFAMARKAL